MPSKWREIHYFRPLDPGHCLNFYESRAQPPLIWSQSKLYSQENEVPTEKNSSRASIVATKASYISN